MKSSKMRDRKTKKHRRTKKNIGGGVIDDLKQAKTDLKEAIKNTSDAKHNLQQLSYELRDWYMRQNRLDQQDDENTDNQPSEYEPGILEDYIEDFIHTNSRYKTAKTQLENAEKKETKQQKKYETMLNSYNKVILQRKNIPEDLVKKISGY